jgi:hypothetical protein
MHGFWMMMWWVPGVVGGCDVVYTGTFSGDVAGWELSVAVTGGLGGDMACRLPTSLDKGRGKRRGLSTDSGGDVEGVGASD